MAADIDVAFVGEQQGVLSAQCDLLDFGGQVKVGVEVVLELDGEVDAHQLHAEHHVARPLFSPIAGLFDFRSCRFFRGG